MTERGLQDTIETRESSQLRRSTLERKGYVMRPGYKRSVAQDTRLWIAVIAVLLLGEVGMHEIMHRVSRLWGLLFAAFLFGVAAMTFRYYRRVQHLSWIIVTGLLSIVGFSIATEALGLELLGGVNLTNILVLGADGPTHGFLAVGHLFADFSVVGIGIYQLRRWFRMRNTGVGLVGIAAVTGCCGTTAIVLAPVFTAVLAAFGVHSDVSYIILAALLTTALIAIAYAWTGGTRRLAPPGERVVVST